VLFEKCQEGKKAKVVAIDQARRIRARPFPLNTIEAQKLISRKLKISSSHSMEIMEKLYQRGFISYPRTETNIYNPTMDLKKIVVEMSQVNELSDFAGKILSG